MGEMDLRHSEYFDSNIRFADAYNGILFGGEQVIKPEELEESDSVFVQLFEKEKGKKSCRQGKNLARTASCHSTFRNSNLYWLSHGFTSDAGRS